LTMTRLQFIVHSNFFTKSESESKSRASNRCSQRACSAFLSGWHSHKVTHAAAACNNSQVLTESASPKFFRKITYIDTLSELAYHVPLTQIDIPPAVYQ